MTIKNIIFDFGNVIINVEPKQIAYRLTDLGVQNLQEFAAFFTTSNAYAGFETGKVSSAGFRDAIRKFFPDKISDEKLDDLWNSILREIPPERVILLEKLRRKYRTFLLSNTNKIHYDHYKKYCCEEYGFELEDLFEKAYFSFQMGTRKPDPEIYLEVIRENGLDPKETLFIDDNADNIEAAVELGIKAILLNEGTDLTELFDENLEINLGL